jgi:hypothetical protein
MKLFIRSLVLAVFAQSIPQGIEGFVNRGLLSDI